MKQVVFSSKKPSNDIGSHTLTIPGSIGHGTMTTIYCHSGLRLIISDYKFCEPTIVQASNPQPCYGFGFCLSGQIEATSSDLKNTFTIEKGQSGFFNFPDTDFYTEVINPERLLRISIFFSQDLLLKLTGRDLEQLPTIMAGDLQLPYRDADTITPFMQESFYQILNCPFKGAAKQLFIEGKILELIAYKINQMDARAQHQPHNNKPTSDEIERVHHAAQLLCLKLESPPSVAELASRVGVCRSKLFTSFQEVFGTTPFGYLQKKRMEAAECMLRAGEINVTQAAYAVGYSSLSHFSKAFKENYGILPSKYSKTNAHSS